jgi:hypothetical protein
MTYWVGMAVVLLIGYALVKRSERANEQEDEGCANSLNISVASGMGTRALGTFTGSPTTNDSKNQSDRGGEA